MEKQSDKNFEICCLETPSLIRGEWGSLHETSADPRVR